MMKMRVYSIIAMTAFFLLTLQVKGQTNSGKPKDEGQSFERIGWNSTYEYGNYDWVIWGEEHPILENRTVQRLWTSNTNSFCYDLGSFYLSENSIILKSAIEEGFYERQTVHFLYDYGYDAVKKNNIFRKEKQYTFRRYGNNYNYVYNDNKELIDWIREMLKNQGKDTDIPIIKVVAYSSNAFGYEYEMISYYLYGYQEHDLKDFNKILFSRPEDAKSVETDNLDVYPTPINDNRPIKDYIDWQISNTPGFYCTAKSASANVKMIIEADGSVSNLIIQNGEFYILSSSRRPDMSCHRNELNGFNNWVAKVINSTKFNPGQLNGKPVRTSCCFEINYRNNHIIEVEKDYVIAFNGEKYGFVKVGYIGNKEYIYDDIQKLGEGRYKVQIDGKWGVMYDADPYYGNFNLKTLIPIQYDNVEHIYNNVYYKVSKDGKVSVYKYDKELFTVGPNIDIESCFYSSYYRWKTIDTKSNKVGLLDSDGQVILQNVYESFSPVRLEYDFYIVKKQGKIGLIRDANQEPGMWFDAVDLKHNNVTVDDSERISFITHNKLNGSKIECWFWVKEQGQDKWGLVEVLKNNKINWIIKPEFDSIISTCEVQKGKKTYSIFVDSDSYKTRKMRITK